MEGEILQSKGCYTNMHSLISSTVWISMSIVMYNYCHHFLFLTLLPLPPPPPGAWSYIDCSLHYIINGCID
jgi:hypothetical protein